ncbi:DUF2793 domain-containing protein [Sphingomonas koreensis]|nr:DUF2793 domain-containing protein [Sphingomonas koreensis]
MAGAAGDRGGDRRTRAGGSLRADRSGPCRGRRTTGVGDRIERARARVTAIGVDDPPADAEVGDCWIVGAAPTGDWAGMTDAIAGWTADGWRFVAPGEGMMAWVTTDAATARYHDGVWELGAVRADRVLIGGRQVLGEQCAPIMGAEGGAVIDDGVRATVAQILVAFRSHGLIAT